MFRVPYGRKGLYLALTVSLILIVAVLPSTWEWSISCFQPYCFSDSPPRASSRPAALPIKNAPSSAYSDQW